MKRAWNYQAGLPDKQAPRIARWQLMLNQHREMFVQNLWKGIFTTIVDWNSTSHIKGLLCLNLGESHRNSFTYQLQPQTLDDRAGTQRFVVGDQTEWAEVLLRHF